MSIAQRVQELLKELPDGVDLVAAAKTRTPDEVLKAVDAGVKIIGQNYINETDRVYPVIGDRVTWHFIGQLQRNKISRIATLFDMVETLDALSDILYVVYGMGASLGLDLDRGMGLVHQSNMSKSCKSEEEAQATVDNYATDDRYDSPAYRKSPDGKYWVVYNKSTGKILKSINYKAVDFTDMLKKT